MTLVLGDVHGNVRALRQVLERSGYSNEKIIFVGDVVDGWPDTKECIDLLLEIGAICLKGNHCEWFQEWAEGRTNGVVDTIWFNQGGRATLRSYGLTDREKDVPYHIVIKADGRLPDSHYDYLKAMRPYYVHENKLFVHGGCGYPYQHPALLDTSDLIWDRDMWQALQFGHDVEHCEFDEIFIGHTATNGNGNTDPVQRGRVWNVDQGAGWYGRLTLMDIDTKQYWQSDLAQDLYPGVRGRW